MDFRHAVGITYPSKYLTCHMSLLGTKGGFSTNFTPIILFQNIIYWTQAEDEADGPVKNKTDIPRDNRCRAESG